MPDLLVTAGSLCCRVETPSQPYARRMASATRRAVSWIAPANPGSTLYMLSMCSVGTTMT